MAKFNECTKQIDLSKEDQEALNGFGNKTFDDGNKFIDWITRPGIKNTKGELLEDEPNFSCPIGAYRSENGCVYPDAKDKAEEQEENDVRERQYIFKN